MAREKFKEIAFRRPTLEVIEKANAIIGEYQGRGYTLTLRQLYYQFVARGLIANKQTEYSRLGSIVNDGRLAGLIDWRAIEDRTRNLRKPNAWGSPEQIVAAVAQQYREDLWADQPNYVEVWVEKEALAGVVDVACEPHRVPHFACRGYVSQSEQYAAAVRLRAKVREGKRVTILHLGDHDPSGIDMTRDNRDRLHLFGSSSIRVKRLALNMDQIEEYNPPPNPAKETDSRHSGYQLEYGDESWELDALPPEMIERLIGDEIMERLDEGIWARSLSAEKANRADLAAASDRWEDVCAYLRQDDDE